jgi:hypothetical protein
MTTTPTMDITPEQMALAGPGYDKDALAGVLQEIAEEDAALASGTIQPPAPAAQPDFATLTVQGDEVEAEGDEPAGEARPLAGKFKSPEELEKAYLALQQKLGQRADSATEESSTADPEPVAPLSREDAVGHYGETVVAAAEREGIDLALWDAAVQKGEDTSAMRDKLAGALGLPAQLIERYEAAFRPAAAADTTAPGLSDEDAAAVRSLVGGDQQFAKLSQWAATNLSEAELASYNDAVNTGSRAAAEMAVRWLQNKAASADKEPDLVLASGGNATPALDVFENEEEALEAKAVLTKGGKQRYLVDEKYRRYIDAKFARSPIFL